MVRKASQRAAKAAVGADTVGVRWSPGLAAWD
jgi:hypothetical protein